MSNSLKLMLVSGGCSGALIVLAISYLLVCNKVSSELLVWCDGTLLFLFAVWVVLSLSMYVGVILSLDWFSSEGLEVTSYSPSSGELVYSYVSFWGVMSVFAFGDVYYFFSELFSFGEDFVCIPIFVSLGVVLCLVALVSWFYLDMGSHIPAMGLLLVLFLVLISYGDLHMVTESFCSYFVGGGCWIVVFTLYFVCNSSNVVGFFLAFLFTSLLMPTLNNLSLAVEFSWVGESLEGVGLAPYWWTMDINLIVFKLVLCLLVLSFFFLGAWISGPEGGGLSLILGLLVFLCSWLGSAYASDQYIYLHVVAFYHVMYLVVPFFWLLAILNCVSFILSSNFMNSFSFYCLYCACLCPLLVTTVIPMGASYLFTSTLFIVSLGYVSSHWVKSGTSLEYSYRMFMFYVCLFFKVLVFLMANYYSFTCGPFDFYVHVVSTTLILDAVMMESLMRKFDFSVSDESLSYKGCLLSGSGLSGLIISFLLFLISLFLGYIRLVWDPYLFCLLVIVMVLYLVGSIALNRYDFLLSAKFPDLYVYNVLYGLLLIMLGYDFTILSLGISIGHKFFVYVFI